MNEAEIEKIVDDMAQVMSFLQEENMEELFAKSVNLLRLIGALSEEMKLRLDAVHRILEDNARKSNDGIIISLTKLDYLMLMTVLKKDRKSKDETENFEA